MQSLSLILFKYKDSVNNLNKLPDSILPAAAVVYGAGQRPAAPAKRGSIEVNRYREVKDIF